MRVVRKDKERYAGREDRDASFNDEKPPNPSICAGVHSQCILTAKHANQQDHPYRPVYRR